PPGEFARTKRFLDALAILDINTGSVPFDDFPRLVSQRVGSKEKPTVRTVETTQAPFSLNRLASSQSQLPIFNQRVAVIRMNRLDPSPASTLFRGHARVVQPALVEEVTVAIRTCSPGGGGNRV